MTSFSFFTGGIHNTTRSTLIDMARAIGIIRSDEYAAQVAKIRNNHDKSIRNVLKKDLSYFCFSGEFRKRNEAGLVKHSGLLQVDFDDVEDLAAIREKLTADSLTHALFLSPTGSGLKAIVKIDGSQHLASFYWLEGYYQHAYGLKIDQACKDVCRACYVSHDPDAYLNENSHAVELPSEEVKFNPETGEVYSEREKLPEDKEKQYKVVEGFVKAVEAAKTDITDDYNDWMCICFSMATLGEAGRELFHRVSSLSPKYSVRDTNDKFNNAIKTSRFTTPAKFISICKSFSIKPIKTAATARPKDAVVDENTEMSFWDSRFNTVLELTDKQRKDVFKYRVTEIGAHYYEAYKFSEYQIMMRPFSNFIIRPLFLVMSKTDPKRIIEIENIYGVRKTIDVPAKAFTSQQEFNVFVESQGNFLFTEKTPPFTLLKVKIYEQTTNAEEVKTLGWNKEAKAYFFANGAWYHNRFHPIDEHGVLEIQAPHQEGDEPKKPKNYFLPALSDIYRDSEESFENEKKFIYIRRDVRFEDWATLFCKVHGHNGMLGLMFYLSSIFSDAIYGKYKFFPHLFLFGLPGSGKSTLAWSLQALFGIAQSPFQLSAGTPVGFFRTFATFRNGLAWFDEYSNDIDQKRIQALKGAYDRAGHVKGMMDNSNKTTTTHINSACVISGQQLPIADVALFKRTILLQFDNTEHSEEAKTNLQQLQEIEQKGLSHITAAMMVFREKVENDFLKIAEEVNKDIMPHLTDVAESRIIINALIPLTMYKLTEEKLRFPFGYEELKSFAIRNIKAQNKLISGSKETSVFWDMVQYLLSQRLITEGEDFKVSYLNTVRITVDGQTVEKSFDRTTALLYLSMSKVHPLYMEHHKKQFTKNGMDKNSITHYLTSQKSFVGVTKSFRFGERVSSAYIFNAEILERDGYDFEKHMEGEPERKVSPAPPSKETVPPLDFENITAPF